MTRLLRCLVPAALLTCIAAPMAAVAAEPACIQRLLGFGNGDAKWALRSFSKLKKDTRYEIRNEGGTSVLHAEAAGSASMDASSFNPPLTAPPILSWRWRTSGPVAGADNRDKSKEDSPLRIIVAFDGDHDKLPDAEKRRFRRAKTFAGKDLPYAALMYTWTDKVPTGTVIPSAHTSQIKMIAIAPEAGTGWQNVSRDLVADYRRAWGSEPGKILGVGVMTDADNTGATASGDYADLRFACSP